MEELRNLVGRQQMISAMLFATENAARVIEICSAPPPADGDTVRALADACGLTDFQAEVILTMPVRRFSPDSVARMRDDLREVEISIDQLRESDS
jgi:hypothetical protein